MSERTKLIQAWLDSLTTPRRVTQTQADGTTEDLTYQLAPEPEPDEAAEEEAR